MKANPFVLGLIAFLLAVAAQQRDLLPDWVPSPIVAEAPIDADGFHVLLIRDVSTQDPKTATVVNSVTLREAVEGKQGVLRVINPTTPPDFAPYAAAIPADTATPTIIVSNSAKGGETAPITTVEAAVALVNKWGG